MAGSSRPVAPNSRLVWKAMPAAERMTAAGSESMVTDMDESGLRAALTAWELGGAYTLRPTPHGVSRFTRFVDTASGSYVACAYVPGTSAERVRYEHRLLSQLGDVGLPFAVPVPVPSADGETLVRAGETDGERLVAVYSVVPGEDVDRRSVAHTGAFGAAVGTLHRALGEIDPGRAPAWDRIYAAMERVLAGEREMVELVRELPLEEGLSRQIGEMLERAMEEGPPLMAALPGQLRHGDCHRGNAMQLDGRISAMLDFEVAGPGPQAMDLAHGVYYLQAWCDPPEAAWDHIGAFASGYRSVREPSEAEVAAVPMLARLYFAASMPALVMRWKDGAATAERLRLRAEQTVRVDEFFEREGERVRAVLSGGA